MNKYGKGKSLMNNDTSDLIKKRREEIIDACGDLYQTMDFADITLKEISKATSFSRPTIYNYFKSREEIFLALMTKEYERWNIELSSILSDNDKLTKEQLADRLAKSLENRSLLLKLMSIGRIAMEGSRRKELLEFFINGFREAFSLMSEIVGKFCTWMPHPEDERFVLTLFSLMPGINSYAGISVEQKAVMDLLGAEFIDQTVYSFAYNFILDLLRGSDMSINNDLAGE